jgi:hypothetical protein
MGELATFQSYWNWSPPAWYAAAETRPFSAASRAKSLPTSGLATPMTKKSNPSSMIPSPASSQYRMCRRVIGASSRAVFS